MKPLLTSILFCIVSNTLLSQTPFEILSTKPTLLNEIDIDGSVTVVFDTELNEEDITIQYISMVNSEDIIVPTTLEFSKIPLSSNSQIKLQPLADLDHNTFYFIKISGNLRDVSGNQFDGNSNGLEDGAPADDKVLTILTELSSDFDEYIETLVEEVAKSVLAQYKIVPDVNTFWIPEVSDFVLEERRKAREALTNFNFVFESIDFSTSDELLIDGQQLYRGTINFYSDSEGRNKEISFYHDGMNIVNDLRSNYRAYLTWAAKESYKAPDPVDLWREELLLDLEAGRYVFQEALVIIRDAAVSYIASVPGKNLEAATLSVVESLVDLPHLLMHGFILLNVDHLDKEINKAQQIPWDSYLPIESTSKSLPYYYYNYIIPNEINNFADLLQAHSHDVSNLKGQLNDIFEVAKGQILGDLLDAGEKELGNLKKIFEIALKAEGIMESLTSEYGYLLDYQADVKVSRGFFPPLPSGSTFNYTLAAIQIYDELISQRNTLSAGSVTPVSGTTTDDYVFSVLYTGMEPDAVKLVVNGSSSNMSASTNNWTSGVEYSLTGTFSTAGEYSYYFEADMPSGNSLRYPINSEQKLAFSVNQSSEGWEVEVLSGGSSIVSPSSINPGDEITVAFRVTNTGLYEYAGLTATTYLVDPSGVTIDQTSEIISQLPIDGTSATEHSLTLPSTVGDGLYSIECTIHPELDTEWTNNILTFQFYIGRLEGQDQYEVLRENFEVKVNDNFTIDSKTYNVIEIDNAKDPYKNTVARVQIQPPTGSAEYVYQNQINIFNIDNYQQFVICKTGGRNTLDGVTWWSANLHGGIGYYSSEGPNFQTRSIVGYRGETTSFYDYDKADLYHSDPDKYHVFTADSRGDNHVSSWYSGTNHLDDRPPMEFKFDVPHDAELGKHRFYFWTEYINGAKYITQLYIVVMEPPPSISSASTLQFSGDDIISISGTHLLPRGVVKFGDFSCPDEQISSWTDTKITLTVPTGLDEGGLRIVNSDGASSSVQYSILSKTGNPENISPIPDQILFAGDTLAVVNLCDYFMDPNPDQELTYSFESNDTLVEVIKESFTNGILEVTYPDNKVSESTISVIATDPTQKSVSQNFKLSVSDRNDPPTIPALPNYVIPEDDTLLISFYALDTLIHDPDNSLNELSISVSNCFECESIMMDSHLAIIPDYDWFGSMYPVLIVNDGQYSAYRSFGLEVQPVSDIPRIVTKISDISLFEDSILVAQYWAMDPDGDTLSYKVLSDTSDVIVTYQDSLLQISTTENWFGQSQILIEVAAPDTAILDSIDVYVLPVNDPPEQFGLIQSDSLLMIEDPDSTQHTFQWESSFDIDGDTITYRLSFAAEGWDSTINDIDSNSFRLNIEGFPRGLNVGWTVFAWDSDTSVGATDTNQVQVHEVVGIVESSVLPLEYSLEQNYPNPFNPTTTVKYGLPEQSNISIVIYDIRGRQIKSWIRPEQKAGWYEVQWNGETDSGSQVSTGLYFTRFEAGEYSRVIKMVYLK